MECVNLGVRILLCSVLTVSGAAKMQDSDGTRQAMVDFGVAAPRVTLYAKLLPFAELSLACLVLFDHTTRLATLGMLVLFARFAAGISKLLRQDKAPPCHCFGAIHSAPVTRLTLLRALGLMGLCLLNLFLPRYLLTPAITPKFFIALLFGLGVTGTLRVAATRHRQARFKRPQGLRVGQRVPAILLDGNIWLERRLRLHAKSLVVVSSANCKPCEEMKHSLRVWQASLQQILPIVWLQAGPDGETAGEEKNWFSISPESAAKFLTPTPGGFLVDRDGTILSPPAAGPQHIAALVRATLDHFYSQPVQTKER